MAEGTFQILNTPLSGEQPFNGDLLEGELVANTADGRIWVGDRGNNPRELGGATKDKPIGNIFTSNYIDVDLSSADNLPISNSNPEFVQPGIYQEARYILRFPSSLSLINQFTSYFDYPIDWGLKSMWDPSSSSSPSITNPINYYRRENQVLVIELSSFGPNSKWMGRLIWAKLTAS